MSQDQNCRNIRLAKPKNYRDTRGGVMLLHFATCLRYTDSYGFRFLECNPPKTVRTTALLSTRHSKPFVRTNVKNVDSKRNCYLLYSLIAWHWFVTISEFPKFCRQNVKRMFNLNVTSQLPMETGCPVLLHSHCVTLF